MDKTPQSAPSPSADFSTDAVSILVQIRDELTALRRQVDSLSSVVAGLAEASSRSSSAVATSTDHLEKMSPAELRAGIEKSLALGDPYAVLNHRLPLAGQLSPPELTELDRELASWFSQYFQTALRSGQALVIAGAMERAVTELTPLPEIEPLAEALPLVRRTIGVWEENLRREDQEDWD